MRAIFSSLLLLAMSLPAFAVEDGTVPEPGSLALIGIAAAAGVAITISRKKKK